MNNEKQPNPLLCDIETGICELPGDPVISKHTDTVAKQEKIQMVYYTDPICSSCWGIEPQLKKLKLEYGNYFNISYRMGGLLPSWDIYNSGGLSKPSDIAVHWDEASAHYDMPIDGDVWLEDPLPSSYPPSIAFKAAQLQDEEKAAKYMRRLREMLFMEKKNITKWEHLQQAAIETGLDATKLKEDYENKAVQLFNDELTIARESGVRGFPTIFFENEGQKEMVYGSRPYEYYEQALLKLNPAAVKQPINTDPEVLFNQFVTLTTKEFTVLSANEKEKAETILHELMQKKFIRKQDSKNGPLWIKNTLLSD